MKTENNENEKTSHEVKEKLNCLLVFSIICYILQITTIFNTYYNNVIISFFYLIFSVCIIFELFLYEHIFIYYIVVLFKTILFLISYKYTGITANGFLAFPLIQISFLYYYSSKYSRGFLFDIIINSLTFSFLVLIYCTTNQNIINPILYYSVFIFVILNLIIKGLKYFPIDESFTIHIKFGTQLIKYLQYIYIPTSGLILFSLAYFPFIDKSYIHIKIIFIIFIIIPSLIDIITYLINKTKYNLKIEISWLFPVIYFIIVGIIYYLLQLSLSEDEYQIKSSNTFNIVIPLAIVNISVLFILLQRNYDKFSSTYLIKQVLKSPVLLISTFFPSIVLFLNVIILDENIKHDFLPSLILILCFVSLFLLVVYFKTVLETNDMLRKLMLSVKEDDFDNYKENIIPINETNIDAILKIIQSLIKNNDIPRSQSTFYSLSFWINENINNINCNKKMYIHQINNRFNSFFSTINHELLSSNNIIIHNYYLKSIQDIIILKITSENFEDYEILFIALHEYLIKRLEKRQEEYAVEIYETIYLRCSVIFLHLKEIQDDQGRLKYDLFEFKQMFLDEKLRKIINTAIENKCNDFLKKIHVFDDMLIIHNFENYNYYNYWDRKVKDIFIETKHLVQQKNMYLLENHCYFFYVDRDYELFLKSNLYSFNIIEYKCYNEIINYVINELETIYNFAISINRKFNDSDFKLLWGECFKAIGKKDRQAFDLFFSFFIILLDRIFEKEYKKTNPDYGMIYNLFSRVLQIKEFENNEFMDIVLLKYNRLIEKHPGLSEIEKFKPKYEHIEKIDFNKRYEI